jgi:hypothetical protein
VAQPDLVDFQSSLASERANQVGVGVWPLAVNPHGPITTPATTFGGSFVK